MGTPVFSWTSQCKGKVPYSTRREAMSVIRSGILRGRRGGQPIAYCCPHCGSHHIGTKTPKYAVKKQNRKAETAP